MICLGEAGIKLSTADSKIGKAYIDKCVRQSGLCSRTDKWTILCAVAGDEDGSRWLAYWTGEGTDGQQMVEFMRHILVNTRLGTNDRRRTFTMDNLSSHHSL